MGDRLQKLRKERKLTAKETAIRIGVAESTYRAWEAGRAIQGEAPYVQLASLFNISLMEILSGVRPERDDVGIALSEVETSLTRLRAALLRAK